MFEIPYAVRKFDQNIGLGCDHVNASGRFSSGWFHAEDPRRALFRNSHVTVGNPVVTIR